MLATEFAVLQQSPTELMGTPLCFDPGAVSTRSTLTADEMIILAALACDLTREELSVELQLSVQALSFKMKVIFRKLGVSTRMEAVDVATRNRILRG